MGISRVLVKASPAFGRRHLLKKHGQNCFCPALFLTFGKFNCRGCQIRSFFSADRRGFESESVTDTRATTDNNDPFLNVGFKHWKKWVDRNGAKEAASCCQPCWNLPGSRSSGSCGRDGVHAREPRTLKPSLNTRQMVSCDCPEPCEHQGVCQLFLTMNRQLAQLAQLPASRVALRKPNPPNEKGTLAISRDLAFSASVPRSLHSHVHSPVS